MADCQNQPKEHSMTDNGQQQARQGFLLVVVGIPLMLGDLIEPRAEPPGYEIGQSCYFAGLALAAMGNF
jgi:hypothetical protein